jgi:HEAT repeat protein
VLGLAQNPTPLLTESADKLVAVLQSQASQKEKADACRQLSVIGTKDAVPALVALLADDKLHHMARYALETIPDPGADAALRQALARLKGRPLAGVIGSLGVRHDAEAVAPLGNLLQDPDADVAQAAARALGRIGTGAAAKALDGALAGVSPGNRLALCEGLLRCAETLMAKGQRNDALAVYDHLRSVSEPHQVRAASLRGSILMRGKDGLPLLLQALRGDDFVLVSAAARTAQELPGPEVTQALATELPQLPADKQIVIIQTLAKRADAAALPALQALARRGPKLVRIEAIRALPQIGHPSAVPSLVELLSDPDAELARLARESLAGLRGQETDAAIDALLKSGEPNQRLTALELIGRRRMVGYVPALLKAAGDADAQVRPAALKKLGELGGPAELSQLVALLERASSAQDLDAAEQALSAICARTPSPEASAEKLVGALASAKPAQKATLLRVLTSVGGAAALQAVRTAVTDTDAEVHSAAIRALGAWKSADAAPELLALAKTSTNPTDKTLCLRSYLDWGSHPDLSAPQRLAICVAASGLVAQPEEKRLLLGALGGIPALEALRMAAPLLEEAATAKEASAAVVSIADKLLKGTDSASIAPQIVEPLRKAGEVAGSSDLGKKARGLLEQAERKATQK